MVIVMMILAIACAPSSIDLSNATDDELDTACNALSKVGYDYYELNVLAIGGRTLEVAASIHTDHAGPDKTQKILRRKVGYATQEEAAWTAIYQADAGAHRRYAGADCRGVPAIASGL